MHFLDVLKVWVVSTINILNKLIIHNISAFNFVQLVVMS